MARMFRGCIDRTVSSDYTLILSAYAFFAVQVQESLHLIAISSHSLGKLVKSEEVDHHHHCWLSTSNGEVLQKKKKSIRNLTVVYMLLFMSNFKDDPSLFTVNATHHLTIAFKCLQSNSSSSSFLVRVLVLDFMLLTTWKAEVDNESLRWVVETTLNTSISVAIYTFAMILATSCSLPRSRSSSSMYIFEFYFAFTRIDFKFR